jgi:hypothetical protein
MRVIMSNTDNQSAEFAINCKPGMGAKPPQHTGKRQAKGHVRAMLRDVRSAHLAGKRKKVEYLSHRYLNSHHARLLATELARRAMKPHRQFLKALVPSIAAGLDPWVGTTEEVRVNMIPKDPDSGNYRLTMDFGPENRALQYLLLRLLREIADLHPHQFGTGNGGMHAAIKHVAQAMKDGYLWAVEIDVVTCFASFGGNGVADLLLPLPKEVTERVLLSRNLNLVPGNLWDLFGEEPGGVHHGPHVVPHSTPHFGPAGGLAIIGTQVLAEARQGIPQGSAASPVLAEMLLSLPLKQLPQMGKVFGYFDNFLVMAKSEDDAVSMAKALGCALQAHPAGPLRPKIRGRFRPGDPIDFLGHRLTMHQGTVLIEPSPPNRQEFEAKMKTELSCLNRKPLSPASRARKIRELGTYVRSWTAAFKLWPQAEIRRKHWLAKISDCS